MLGAMNVATVITIAIPAVIVLGLVVLAVAAYRQPRKGVGTLDREAMKRDEARTRLDAAKTAALARSAARTTVGETALAVPGEQEAPREPAAGQLAVLEEDRPIEVYAPQILTPPDPVEVGIARRQVLTRLALAGSAVGLAAFGISSIAFLIPAPTKGFGSKIIVDTPIDQIKAQIAQKKEPFYFPDAKTYLMTYAPKDPKEAEAAYSDIWKPLQQTGLMPLYQKCVHLGCKVPWCASSQWFECPCHGSQYNEAGEKQGGPAPRGLDRFQFSVTGNTITIDTGNIILGPPIGTDTIGEPAQGPHCV